MKSLSSLITAIGLTRASDSDVREGLLGYVTFTIANTWLIDGITLRRTAKGRPTLSYPAKTDRHGRRRSFVRPLDDPSRRAIESAVFEALGVEQEDAS